MTAKTDPLALLSTYRPTDVMLEDEWPQAQRAAMRQRIQASAPSTAPARPVLRPARRQRRQWIRATVLVGAAAAALLVVQLAPREHNGSPGARPIAPAAVVAPLEKLVAAAEATPTDGLRPGEFRHLVGRQSDGTTLEGWTAYDGRLWRRDNDNGTFAYYAFPALPGDVNSPSASYLATLPTDAAQLQSYLETHVCGSTSRDEAVFVGVGDLLRGDFASTALRVAAIKVLEHTGHITIRSATDALGRRALQVVFTDPAKRPGETQALFFDRTTSALLQQQTTGAQAFTASYTGAATVNRVPADVLAKAVPQKDTVQASPGGGANPACADKWSQSR